MKAALGLKWAGWLMVVSALVLMGCSSPQGTEAQVRNQLEKLAHAVEDRDAGDVYDLLAEDFSGPSGMDRDRARAYASVMMRRYSDMTVVWTVDEMDIIGDRARVRVSVVLTGKASVRGFGGRGRLMDVEMGWRYTDGEWLLVSARWSNKLG